MVSAYDFIYDFQDMGIFDIVLPFLLIFAIIFAILEKSKIFGTNAEGGAKSNINLIVSLVIGLIVVVQTDIVNKINTYLPKMALVYVIAIGLLIFFGLMSTSKKNVVLPTYFAVVLGAIGVIWALASGTGFGWPDWLRLTTDTARQTIIWIGVAIIVIWIVYGGSRNKPSKPSGGKSGREAFKDWLSDFEEEKS